MWDDPGEPAGPRPRWVTPEPPRTLPARHHSGLVIETARDAWIYCKASKKMVAGNQLLPWLSATTAVISAITGVAVFTSLQDDPSTWAKAVVGAVAIVTAAIAGLQTWAASRSRSLNDQAQKFHELHREMFGDIEAGSDLDVADYATAKEAKLQGIMAGISEPSHRLWRESEERVDQEMLMLFPSLALGRAPYAPSD